jgi:GT2 family glycosyltransferase
LPDRDWLQKAAKLFEDEKVVELSGPYSFYDASDSFNMSKIWQQKYLMGTLNIVLQWLHLGATANEGNSFFRASTLELVGGFDKSIVFYGDGANIAKRLSKVGKIIFSRDLIMPTSARRFNNEGRVKTQAMYVYHFLKETFNRKNLTSKPN